MTGLGELWRGGLVEGFVGGGCFGEGKGDGEILVEFWSLCWNKWR